jgi:hypothetical protein
MSPWNRRPLTIPPDSMDAWIRLAVWELWMGMVVCLVGGLGVLLITSASGHVVVVSDLSKCYAAPPVALPCEQIVYRGGALYSAFSASCGVMLVGVAAWILWELWSAFEPKPIADDFLKLLNDSFGRDWRNPLTWPWARALWAYGFTLVGLTLTAGISVIILTLMASSYPVEAPRPRIETSQSFRPGQ